MITAPEAPRGEDGGGAASAHIFRVRLLTFALAGGLALIAGGGVAVLATGTLGAPLADLPEAGTWMVGLYVAASLLAARILHRKILGAIGGGASREEILERHFRSVTVAMALREGSGVLGAVWGTLTGSLPWLLVLSAPPLLTMVLAWPGRREVADLLRRQPSGEPGPP